jgi:hypothetical protein
MENRNQKATLINKVGGYSSTGIGRFPAKEMTATYITAAIIHNNK